MSCGLCWSDVDEVEDLEVVAAEEEEEDVLGIGGIEALGEIWECLLGPIVVLCVWSDNWG